MYVCHNSPTVAYVIKPVQRSAEKRRVMISTRGNQTRQKIIKLFVCSLSVLTKAQQ